MLIWKQSTWSLIWHCSCFWWSDKFLKCLNALHRDSLCTPTITREDFTSSYVNDRFAGNMMPDVLWLLSFSLPGMKSSLIISLTQTTSLVHTHSIFVCLGIYYNAVLLYTLEMIFRIVTRPQSHFYQSDDEITQCLIYHVISLPTLWLILFRYFMFSEKWHP